jgi:DNA polymerase III delta prime subunit
MAIAPYQNSIEHIFEELNRLALFVKRQIYKFRMASNGDGRANSDLAGLYIDDAEIDELLAQSIYFNCHQLTAEQKAILNRLDEEIEAISQYIYQRQAASQQQGVRLRLLEIMTSFQLTQLERDIIVICLALEIDPNYERFYAYLQDDITRKYPSVRLIFDLLAISHREKIACRQFLHQDSPLLRYGIINIFSYIQQATEPAIAPSVSNQQVKLDPAIVNFLLETETKPQFPWQLGDGCNLKQLYIRDRDRQSLQEISANYQLNAKSWILYLQGNDLREKQMLAQAVCQEQAIGIREINLLNLTQLDAENFHQQCQRIVRDAKIDRQAVFVKNFDCLCEVPSQEYLNFWHQIVADLVNIYFFSAQTSWQPAAFPAQNCILSYMQLPEIGAGDRCQIWQNILGDRLSDEVAAELPKLATQFRWQRGQIHQAAMAAKHLASWRNPASGEIAAADLYQACRLHSNSQLDILAHRIKPRRQWVDLVLPADRHQQLKEICTYVKYRIKVYEQWGFDRKLSSGKGLTALFSGASGTGKTMAAEVLAGDLGVELYKIDLSAVVSKYIGETEKHLGGIFEAGETSNAILFFDEADALFGKRTQVSDARDRYANIEVSYLLQRLEEYEGIAILTTNFRRNMDDAFLRRLHFTVDFPLPAEPERHLIWESILPTELPRSQDLDLAFMARQFELAGGNIRNIALTAAFLAAEEDSQLHMRHLIRATQREYQKMGKVLRKEDFGAYAGLL